MSGPTRGMVDLRRGKPRRIRQKVGLVNIQRSAAAAQWLMDKWGDQIRAEIRGEMEREARS